MAYNAATAAANKAASMGNGIQDLVQAMVEAFREASQPALPDKVEIVTVGQTSDKNLDRLLFCPDCLGREGPAWGPHKIFWIVADPERPGQTKRAELLHAHPRVPKTISYEAIGARKGLDEGTYGKQCLQCGVKLGVTV